MPCDSVVFRLADHAADLILSGATVVVGEEKHPVTILEAVQRAVSERWMLDTLDGWYVRLGDVSFFEIRSQSYWTGQVFTGGRTVHEKFANFVRGLAAGAVEHLLFTDERYRPAYRRGIGNCLARRQYVGDSVVSVA